MPSGPPSDSHTTNVDCGFLRASAMLPSGHSTTFLIPGEILPFLGTSRSTEMETEAYKRFWSCHQRERLRLWRQPQRRFVAYLRLAGLALHCSVFEPDLNPDIAVRRLQAADSQPARLDNERLGLPGQLEGLRSLGIGSHSLAIGPLCDFRFPLPDLGLDLRLDLCLDPGLYLDRRRRCRGRRNKLGSCVERRRLRWDARNRSGKNSRLLACIEVHPRRDDPV